jgi:hypothetical protein
VGSEVRETDAAPDLTSAASEELDDDDSTLVELSDSLEAEALLHSTTTTDTTMTAHIIVNNHDEAASESTSLTLYTETEETTRQQTWPEMTHEIKQPVPLIAECLAQFQEFFVR